VYYFDENNNVNELAWLGSYWHHSVLPAVAAAGSALTCFGFNGNESRVYYFDEDNKVNELAWVGSHWVNNVLPNPTEPAVAAAGSGLTSFGVTGTEPVVYYAIPS
jgi:hypothetical protein